MNNKGLVGHKRTQANCIQISLSDLLYVKLCKLKDIYYIHCTNVPVDGNIIYKNAFTKYKLLYIGF